MPENRLEHIALILDGNKRWAKKNKVSQKEAYRAGLKNINNLISNCLKIKLPYLTLFTLSSENINRSSVNNIFNVIYEDFSFFFDKIIDEKKVRINIFGSRKNLPKKIIDLINHCELKTKNNDEIILNLAFNYGFKEEIKNIILKSIQNTKIDMSKDENIRSLFYLGKIPDPDLLIRTGGYQRLSNFIMYNLTYSEIYFEKTLWPDFDEIHLMNIIYKFKNTLRTYGL